MVNLLGYAIYEVLAKGHLCLVVNVCLASFCDSFVLQITTIRNNTI